MDVRPFDSETDRPQVEALLAASSEADGFPSLGESKFVDFHGEGHGLGLVAATNEGLVGYTHLLRQVTSGVWEMEMVLDPQHRNIDVVNSLLAAARRMVDGTLVWWVFGAQAVRLADGAGMEVLRELHKLRGALPPSEAALLPEWAAVRAFRPELDIEAWLLANNAAFAGHLENGNWSAGDLLLRMDRDWFEAEGFRLSWADGRVAGFCWTKRHSPEVGEIFVVGVHPDYQGRGLGRAIVIEAMEYLADVGCRECVLYVDTANSSALDLYRSLGFELERVDRCVVVPKV